MQSDRNDIGTMMIFRMSFWEHCLRVVSRYGRVHSTGPTLLWYVNVYGMSMLLSSSSLAMSNTELLTSLM